MADDSAQLAGNPNALLSLSYQGVQWNSAPPTPRNMGKNRFKYDAGDVRCTASWNAASNVLAFSHHSTGKALYLPWREDNVTYARLPGDCQLFCTGPFTGCNFYAAGDPAAPVVMHTNSNTDRGDRAKNNAAKQELAASVLDAENVRDISHSMEWKDYEALQLTGYVFGFKSAAAWDFKIIGINTNTMRNMSATLRRR
jgi:hypothetical protein